MRRFSCWFLFAVLLLSATPRGAFACPLCQDAIANGSGLDTEEDPVRLGQAYNRSIYLMAGMPYFLLGVVGFVIYRKLRVQAGSRPQVAPTQPLPPGDPFLASVPGDRACSTPSRDAAS